MNEGDAPKRRAYRARTTAGLGHLHPHFCLAGWASENSLSAWPSVERARERIDEVLLVYSMMIDWRDAAINEREKARAKIRAATASLIEALGAPAAGDVLNGMHTFPVASQFNAMVYGSPVHGDLGEVPGNLSGLLKRFMTALDARVWASEGDEDAAPGDNGPPAFHCLIGDLRSIFEDAFPRAAFRVFDRFARDILEAAEVRPVNGAPFSETAIRDAWRGFKDAGLSE